MSQLPEALVRVVQALVADETFALWFESLADAPAFARETEFRQMSARMQAAQSDPELTQAVGLLAVADAYEGVLGAYRELRNEL